MPSLAARSATWRSSGFPKRLGGQQRQLTVAADAVAEGVVPPLRQLVLDGLERRAKRRFGFLAVDVLAGELEGPEPGQADSRRAVAPGGHVPLLVHRRLPVPDRLTQLVHPLIEESVPEILVPQVGPVRSVLVEEAALVEEGHLGGEAEAAVACGMVELEEGETHT